MKFADIPGLSEIKSRLLDSVKQNHIAHAQLFLGKAGALNLPLALAYANYLHCQNKSEEDACGIYTCQALVAEVYVGGDDVCGPGGSDGDSVSGIFVCDTCGVDVCDVGGRGALCCVIAAVCLKASPQALFGHGG